MIWIGAALAVDFGPALVPVGSTVSLEHTTHFELDLDVLLWGTRSKQRVERAHDEALELVRQADGFEVTWTRNHHRTIEPGYQHDRDLPGLGQRVRSVQGEVPGAPAELAAIVGQLRVFDDLEDLRALLGPALAVGQRVPAGPLFGGMITEVPGVPEVRGSLVFRGIEGVGDAALGRFDVELELTANGVDPRGATVATVVHGTGVLELQVRSGLTTRFDLDGTVAVEATRAGLQTTGTGAFKVRTQFGYSP